ncbi:hypothetical protein CERSUDRAFT_74248 [Gelatoporia subvermispora B]|uniref:Uncharacterized protein n=1 Tax=Ceriporiopsis subvermispora (strain B) TaxID=914234 RepID=M2PJ38_CERS8|nr:hypothetical protein CERSUDRAFT_74248 [Gelatoporia subvermispora B]
MARAKIPTAARRHVRFNSPVHVSNRASAVMGLAPRELHRRGILVRQTRALAAGQPVAPSSPAPVHTQRRSARLARQAPEFQGLTTFRKVVRAKPPLVRRSGLTSSIVRIGSLELIEANQRPNTQRLVVKRGAVGEMERDLQAANREERLRQWEQQQRREQEERTKRIIEEQIARLPDIARLQRLAACGRSMSEISTEVEVEVPEPPQSKVLKSPKLKKVMSPRKSVAHAKPPSTQQLLVDNKKAERKQRKAAKQDPKPEPQAAKPASRSSPRKKPASRASQPEFIQGSSKGAAR